MRDNIETDYLIFVSSDGKKTGLDIFNERIKKNKWPIYSKTPQQLNIKEGKKVVFYIAGAGEKKQSFVGTAQIKSIIDNNTVSTDPNQEFKSVLFFIEFKNLKVFNEEIKIKEHLNKLDFIKNKKKYGLYFQGGICKINQESYEYILQKSYS